MQKSYIFKMILCALFTALTAVLSQIYIPIGPVPINLATFAVFCAGGLLGSKRGALSMIIWTMLGAAGAPVYTMYRNGFGTLFGLTGGYIFGYILAAFLVGFVIERFNSKNKVYLHAVAMLAGALVYFTLGTAWYMFSANASITKALTACVIPFIPGDLAKIAVASVLVRHLRPVLSFNTISI